MVKMLSSKDLLWSQDLPNDLIKDDVGPWGAQVALAAKPHQDGAPWRQWQLLCILHHQLNQVTHLLAIAEVWHSQAGKSCHECKGRKPVAASWQIRQHLLGPLSRILLKQTNLQD